MMLYGCAALVAIQLPMFVLLLLRLAPGRTRRPPMAPVLTPSTDTSVTVLVATLNEAARIQPCLDGLMQQVAPLLEVLIVDSHSTDGTQALVHAATARDARIKLVIDEPLPDGWVGKVWALDNGLRHARGEWILGIDADTVPAVGLVGAVIDAATRDNFDVASFSPRFEKQSAGERFVQPAMLTTLVYRCGAAGVTQPPPDRVLANGQCFLAKRALLQQHGGYAPARASFCDDVTLARHLASRGARVGFLDGSKIIRVRSYSSFGEMWREWGRSFDLKDATTPWRRAVDLLLVWSVQAAPLPVLLGLSWNWRALTGESSSDVTRALVHAMLAVNASALALRLFMVFALRGSYATRGVSFWCSWLADMPAAMRLTWSMLRTPSRWRGRSYAPMSAVR